MNSLNIKELDGGVPFPTKEMWFFRALRIVGSFTWRLHWEGSLSLIY